MFGSTELIKGSLGEQRAIRYFRMKGFNVVNVSSDKEYQKKDIDLLLVASGREIGIEIKYSSKAHLNNTVTVEDIMNIKKNKPGWIHYCAADYIAVISGSKMLLYKPEEMRDYLRALKSGQAKYVAGKKYITERIIKDSTAIIYYVDLIEYSKLGYYSKIVTIC